MNKPTPRSVFIVLLILASGIAVGAWAMRLYFERTLMAWSPTDRFVEKMGHDLDLSTNQRIKVTDILIDQKKQMEDMRAQWRLDVRKLARQGEDRIARELTLSQTDLFMKQHDAIHNRMDRYLWTAETGATAIAISAGAQPGK